MHEGSMDSPLESFPDPQTKPDVNGDPESPQTSLPSPSSGGKPPGALGLKARRALNRTLTQRGISEEDLPLQLRDTVAKKSRKGKAGQIVLRSLSGVQKSPAAQLARKLEHEIAGNREDVIEKLQASPTAGAGVRQVAALLESNPKFSLARAIVEAGADVAHVLDHYAKGALALKKLETVLTLYREMPNLMRDIMRHAVDSEGTCEICFGEGKVVPKANGKTLSKPCPRCAGSGKQHTSSPHKEFAANKMLELSGLAPKGSAPMVNVNQAVQVNAGGGSEVLARLSKAADELLYGGRPGGGYLNPGSVVDAEEVKGDE